MLLCLLSLLVFNLFELIENATQNKILFIILAILDINSKAIVSLVLSPKFVGIKKLKNVEAQYNSNADINQNSAVLYAGIVFLICVIV